MTHERLLIIDLNKETKPSQGTDTAWVKHNDEIYKSTWTDFKISTEVLNPVNAFDSFKRI